jgi:hypothetical protein
LGAELDKLIEELRPGIELPSKHDREDNQEDAQTAETQKKDPGTQEQAAPAAQEETKPSSDDPSEDQTV